MVVLVLLLLLLLAQSSYSGWANVITIRTKYGGVKIRGYHGVLGPSRVPTTLRLHRSSLLIPLVTCTILILIGPQYGPAKKKAPKYEQKRYPF